MRSMKSYTILPSPDRDSFKVATQNRSGGWDTVRSFTTLAEAEAWIAQEERLSEAANPFQTGGSATKRGW